ncbi:hypothetical protein ENSA5_39160 [Enhygromyxa salina]|uniref:Uncharacterized protein n=1 Tax=Enhygromyxa salina TaxID=215803 RepID=A0A2S9XRX6_9BACT|nr:hypothetical protein ENSA5_39160 [Enhygromyxa salina]
MVHGGNRHTEVLGPAQSWGELEPPSEATLQVTLDCAPERSPGGMVPPNRGGRWFGSLPSTRSPARDDTVGCTTGSYP